MYWFLVGPACNYLSVKATGKLYTVRKCLNLACERNVEWSKAKLHFISLQYKASKKTLIASGQMPGKEFVIAENLLYLFLHCWISSPNPKVLRITISYWQTAFSTNSRSHQPSCVLMTRMRILFNISRNLTNGPRSWTPLITHHYRQVWLLLALTITLILP